MWMRTLGSIGALAVMALLCSPLVVEAWQDATAPSAGTVIAGSNATTQEVPARATDASGVLGAPRANDELAGNLRENFANLQGLVGDGGGNASRARTDDDLRREIDELREEVRALRRMLGEGRAPAAGAPSPRAGGVTGARGRLSTRAEVAGGSREILLPRTALAPDRLPGAASGVWPRSRGEAPPPEQAPGATGAGEWRSRGEAPARIWSGRTLTGGWSAGGWSGAGIPDPAPEPPAVGEPPLPPDAPPPPFFRRGASQPDDFAPPARTRVRRGVPGPTLADGFFEQQGRTESAPEPPTWEGAILESIEQLRSDVKDLRELVEEIHRKVMGGSPTGRNTTATR